MSRQKGHIVLMGSGELTATMVGVHRELLAAFPADRKAVFLDTPAGFQLNADQISQRAVDYFLTHVQQPLAIASFKSRDRISSYDAEKAYQRLRDADYTLIGPGSPTYTVDQLLPTPIPKIIVRGVETGGCFVAASAAALTVGRFTLPVYEIYKVGQEIHWVEGVNILDHFGFDLVVIPHWNNAEGGSHDTRRCFMGETRFKDLESLLPEGVSVLGLDEHTACILDLNSGEGCVRGIGRMVFRQGRAEMVFQKGDHFPLDILRGKGVADVARPPAVLGSGDRDPIIPEVADSFWDNIHQVEAEFQEGMDRPDPELAINALLQLDQIIWMARQDLESEESVSQAREILRECLVLMGTILVPSSGRLEGQLTALVGSLLSLRENLRLQNRWQEADAIRECLGQAGLSIEDTEEGPLWKSQS